MSVATYIRDVFDTLQTQFDPNFVVASNFQDLSHIVGAAFNVGMQYMGQTLKDIVLLRPLTSWVELPGVIQSHYNPFMPEPSLDVYDLGKSFFGRPNQGMDEGIANGLCLSFPSSPAQLYAVGALFIWGLPCAVFAAAGCVCGTLAGFIPILLGDEHLFGLWHRYETVPAIFGVVLTAYLSIHLFRGVSTVQEDITWQNKRMLARRFWLTFFGSLINTAGLFPWIEGVNASDVGTPFSGADVAVGAPGWFYPFCLSVYFICLALGLFYGHAFYGLLFFFLYRRIFFNFGVEISPEARDRICAGIAWTGVYLINTGSVFALSWVGTDAMLHGNAGFLKDDRALFDLKHPQNIWYCRTWEMDGFGRPANPNTIWEASSETLDDTWEALNVTTPASFDAYSYNDDWRILSPDWVPGEGTEIDELWYIREDNKWKTDEHYENPLLESFEFLTHNQKFEKAADAAEVRRRADDVDLFARADQNKYGMDVSDTVYKRDTFVYPDFVVPRLSREDARPSRYADKKSFLSEIMRGVFRSDVTVAMIDKQTVDEEDMNLDEIEQARNLIDWRNRYRGNPFYRLTFPAVEWAGTKFRASPRHKLNVNQSYDASCRRGMLMNYLSFVERAQDRSSQLAPQSMPRRAYNHQFRGNIGNISAWNLLDIHYAQRYDVLRGVDLSPTKLGQASTPWYDLPQRWQAPWHGKQGRYGAQKPQAPADYRLLPSMQGAKSVVTFDLPGWNVYSQEAKHALHEELWPQASALPRSQPGRDALLASEDTSHLGAKAQSKNAQDMKTFGFVANSDQPTMLTTLGEKMQRIEHWFRPDAKHAEEILNHFGRYHVPSAPMYVGWDENNKKMLVRQARLPNFIDHKVTVPGHATVPSTPETGADRDEESSSDLEGAPKAEGKAQGKLPTPVWWRFSAWAPNGILNPSKKHFYRTFELNATTLELQRFVSMYDFQNPDEERDDELRLDDVDDGVIDEEGDSLFVAAPRENIQGQLELTIEHDERTMGTDTGFAHVDDRSYAAKLTKEIARLYELRNRVPFNTLSSEMPLGLVDPGYRWTDKWDVLGRMPQVQLEHLAADAMSHVPEETSFSNTDYGVIGYLLPPGLGGVAWPGSYDVRQLPDGARDKTMGCQITRPNWKDLSLPVHYVLKSNQFDMRNIISAYDVGVFHRRMMDSANYFENPPEDRPSWTLAPAEFERIYETYRKTK